MSAYEMRWAILLHMMETYRDTPPEKRQLADWLIAKSLRATGSPEEKKLHNVIALQFITNTRPAHYKICAALHMGRGSFDDVLGHALDRLMVLTFGVDGIDWE